MYGIQLFELLSKFGADVVLCAVCTALILFFADNFYPLLRGKAGGVIPYLLALCVYFLYLVLTSNKVDPTLCFSGGMTAGGLAMVILTACGKSIGGRTKREKIVRILTVVSDKNTANEMAKEILSLPNNLTSEQLLKEINDIISSRSVGFKGVEFISSVVIDVLTEK